jgi:tRNA 2-selenouridine synthase
MAITKVNIDEFFSLSPDVPVLDGRSPSEYLHAHIPGAFSFPIFNDDERKKIGTAYKQESREKAIKIGLDAFGKKMSSMIEDAEELFIKNKIKGTLLAGRDAQCRDCMAARSVWL